MEKYICIHGHFYQPPRENPWLDDVELQDSAHPNHDWNERVTEECYRQNAASRILGKDRKIVDIVNNYKYMSFNFGPTLLYWMEKHAPDVYKSILQADKESCEQFGGHGSAISQVWGHMIMPLCNERDKFTQVYWGIRDFEKRFGRRPKGMWLAETAVDSATLEALAEQGIEFTILAPGQAKAVRKIGDKKWQETDASKLDTCLPYVCRLESGRSIDLFFYNGPASHDVAYGGLLHSGENFANRLASSFGSGDGNGRLVHIATDGESFGHHHRHGDMALAYCLHNIHTKSDANITVYSQFLEKFPPQWEVQIHENSSWSCAHGIERWRSNCGCCGDQEYVGKQQWREPLRDALNDLRDDLAYLFEERMKEYVKDPWQVRNEYIEIVNDRSDENVNACMEKWTGKVLDPESKTAVLRLLEMQRMSMMMFTSCGWFFDDISGIETVQIMQYASRAMQIASEFDSQDYESEFMEKLRDAPSNKDGHRDGKQIYQSQVVPSKIDLKRVGAHFALSSIFLNGEDPLSDIFSYSTTIEEFKRYEAGIQVMTISRVNIRSRITHHSQAMDIVGLYLGAQNLFAAISHKMHDDPFWQLVRELEEAFSNGDISQVMRMMNVAFESKSYSISSLFKDEQRKILNELLQSTWQEIESSYRHIYVHNYAIMQMIANMKMPMPPAFAVPLQFIINLDICRQLQSDEINYPELRKRLEEARRFSLSLDQKLIKFEAGRKLSKLFETLSEKPEDLKLLLQCERLLSLLKIILTDLNLQKPQNIFFTLSKTIHKEIAKRAEDGDETAKQWVEHFRKLADQLELVISD